MRRTWTSDETREIEKALLGSIIWSPAAFWRVEDILLPEHFLESAHRSIFAAIAKIARDHNLRDDTGFWIAAIKAELTDLRIPIWLAASHTRYIDVLLSEACTTITAREYAWLIRNAAADRAAKSSVIMEAA